MAEQSSPTRWRRRLESVNWWWIAPALGAVCVFALWRQQGQIPSRGDWERATDTIREELKPGDGVTWAPYWAGEGRLYLHGLPGFHVPDITHPDFSRYKRVWLLGAFGASASDLPGWKRSLIKREQFGNITLDLVEVVEPRVVSDLRADLDKAAVRRVRGKTTKACDFWSGEGWHCDLKFSPEKTRACLAKPINQRHRMRRRNPNCGLNRWLHVSRDVRVIGDSPRRCIWMHPKAKTRVETRWTVPAADTLVIDYGFADQMISDHPKPGTRVKPARIEVLFDGRPLDTKVVEPVKGWNRWRMSLGGHGGEITLVITSDSTVDAHLCLDVTARKGGRDE